MTFDDHSFYQTSFSLDSSGGSSVGRRLTDDSGGIEIHGTDRWKLWGILTAFSLVLVAIPVFISFRSEETNILLLSVIPASWVFVLFLFMPKSHSFYITRQGIENIRTGEIVLFDGIQRLLMNEYGQVPRFGKLKHGKICLATDVNEIMIPPNIEKDIVDLFTRIHDSVPKTGTPVVDRGLAQYAQESKELFGADKVFEFSGGRKTMPGNTGIKAVFFLGIASVLSGLVPVLRDPDNELYAGFGGMSIGFGFIAAFFAGLLLLAEWLKRFNSFQTELVISPRGMALRYGELHGALRWDEIKNILFRGVKVIATRPQLNTLWVEVEGATFILADFFDRPLSVIAEHLYRNWRPVRRGPGSSIGARPVEPPPVKRQDPPPVEQNFAEQRNEFPVD